MSAEDLKREFSSRILLQSRSLLVFNKPAGYETVVKGGGNTRFCLTSIVRRALNCDIFPCHRLDRDTSGCQLFALNDSSLAYFEEIFKKQKINKIYLGICLGDIKSKKGKVTKALSAWGGGKEPVRITADNERDALSARTDYRVIAGSSSSAEEGSEIMSLASFKLFTGRTHQIRVHCKYLKHPLVGDDQYGNRGFNKAVKGRTGFSRQALHAWKLSFNSPDDGENITVEAPLESDFKKFLDFYFKNWKKALYG
ncbi:MAG: RluA family pseudouridine synthase [Planctomycetota bacterium]